MVLEKTKRIKAMGLTKKSIDLEREEAVVSKKKTLWDIAEDLAKKPLFTIDEKDRNLVYGSNMMTRLLQEDEIYYKYLGCKNTDEQPWRNCYKN
jgi:hypothetical protein